MSLTCSSSSCERNWSVFEMVRPNDFGILWQDDFSFSFLVKSLFLPPSSVWEFSIKIVTTIGTLKNEKLLTPEKNEWLSLRYVQLEDKREKS